MTKKQAARILSDHNPWRRYAGKPDDSPIQMINPFILGLAIDKAVAVLTAKPRKARK